MVIPDHSGVSARKAPAAAPGRLTEATARQLADRIRAGLYPVGSKLPPERQLCVDLGVSRIVLREALKALAERGLVEVRPGVGSFVTALDAAVASRQLSRVIQDRQVEPDHLFEIRRLLEPSMAAQAARNTTPELIDAMQANLLLTHSAVERLGDSEAQIEAFAWADLEFHQLVATATGNPLYEMLLNPLLDNLLDLRRLGVKVSGSARQALNDHRRVFERIRDGDPKGAQRAMLEHIDAVRAWAEASAPSA